MNVLTSCGRLLNDLCTFNLRFVSKRENRKNLVFLHNFCSDSKISCLKSIHFSPFMFFYHLCKRSRSVGAMLSKREKKAGLYLASIHLMT